MAQLQISRSAHFYQQLQQQYSHQAGRQLAQAGAEETFAHTLQQELEQHQIDNPQFSDTVQGQTVTSRVEDESAHESLNRGRAAAVKNGSINAEAAVSLYSLIQHMG